MKVFESPTGKAEIHEPGDVVEPTPDGKAYTEAQARSVAAVAVIEQQFKQKFDEELVKAKAAKVPVPGGASVAAESVSRSNGKSAKT